MTDFHIVIPARYASTRLPGKPLLEIDGRPMILHVLEQCQKSGAQTVTVATDDQRILSAVTNAGGYGVMTAEEHQSGTDRIADACRQLSLQEDDIVVNVQGDEPEIPPKLIQQVAGLLVEDSSAVMATACTPIEDRQQLEDPNVVKVARNHNQQALYFSRQPIPWSDHEDVSNMRRHIGIYAYRSGFLQMFSALPPCDLEKMERLEQLRALWNGYAIVCADAVEIPPPGVDSDADLEATRARFAV